MRKNGGCDVTCSAGRAIASDRLAVGEITATSTSHLEDQLANAERSLLCAERIDDFARMERETAYWRGRVAEIKRQITDETAYLRSAVDALGDRHAS